MVEHGVQHDLYAALVRLFNEFFQVRVRAEHLVDVIVIDGVVLVVARGAEHGREVDGVYAKPAKVVKFLDDPAQVASVKALRVGDLTPLSVDIRSVLFPVSAAKAVDEDLVEHRAVAPLRLAMQVRCIDVWVLKKVVIALFMVVIDGQPLFGIVIRLLAACEVKDVSFVDQYFNSGYLLSFGAYVFGDTHDDIGLNADNAATGLNLFRDLAGVLGSNCISQNATTQVATYLTNSAGTAFCTIGTPDWLTTFQENLTATYVRGGMSQTEAEEAAAENLVVVAPPRLPKDGDITKELTDIEEETFAPTTMGGVNAFSISSYTQYPKACLAFVKFVSEYENLKWRSEALGAVPARTDLAEELGGVSEILSERVSSGLVYMMPSSRDTQYIWDPLTSLFNDVATDNTTRQTPIYTTTEALQGALDKLVADIRSAMAIGDIS